MMIVKMVSDDGDDDHDDRIDDEKNYDDEENYDDDDHILLALPSGDIMMVVMIRMIRMWMRI